MRSSRVLITGAGGFIGRRLVRRLLRDGATVIAVDTRAEMLKPPKDHSLRPQFHQVVCDIAQPASVSTLAPHAKGTDCLVHLAAHHYIPFCEEQVRETVRVNTGGLANLMTVLEDVGEPRRIIFASTADVYADGPWPMAESSPISAKTIYGMTKLLGERMVQDWCQNSPDREFTNVRLFNVYGPGDEVPHLVPHVVKSALAGGIVPLGSLSPRRDYIYVDDVADVLANILTFRNSPNLINVGSGVSMSVDEVVAAVGRAIGIKIRILVEQARVRTVERESLWADTSLLRSYVPAFEARPFAEGINLLLDESR